MLLSIVSCTKLIDTKQPDAIETKEAMNEEPVAPEIIEKIPPLIVKVYADKTIAELSLDSKVLCAATGGKGAYSYDWTLDDDEMGNCRERKDCDVSVEIGNYSVKCKVADESNQSVSDEIKLFVTKDYVDIDDIILFGDSLTAGFGLVTPADSRWGSLYSQKFKKAEIHNYAISGATSYSVEAYQMMLFENDSINDDHNKLVFLWIGANDAVSLIHPEDYKRNLEIVLNKLSKLNNTIVVILNVPDASKLSIASDIEEELNYIAEQLQLGMGIEAKKFVQDSIAVYNQEIDSVAGRYNVPVIDMFNFMDSFDDSLITPDGFHPNEMGHKLISEKVKEDVEASFDKKILR